MWVIGSRHVGQTGGASEAAGGLLMVQSWVGEGTGLGPGGAKPSKGRGRVGTGGARKGWQWRAEPGKGDYRIPPGPDRLFWLLSTPVAGPLPGCTNWAWARRLY